MSLIKATTKPELKKPITRQWGSVNKRCRRWRHSSVGAQAFPVLDEGACLRLAWRLTRTNLWMIKRDAMKRHCPGL